MKAFERFRDSDNFRHPEDMPLILNYLSQNGKINVSPEQIEELYGNFSEEEYCAGWMTISESTLSAFAEYLSQKEI